MLIWILPIASGLADAMSRGVMKLSNIHRFTLTAGTYFAVLPFWGLWLWWQGMPEIEPEFWRILFLHAPLLTLATILTIEAHRSSNLTKTAPYLALTSAFLLITSPLMDAGTPNLWGAIGVLVITIGVYLLNTREAEMGVLTPFRNLKSDRGSRLMFAVAVIFAITANLDLLALEASSVPFYLLADHFLVGLFGILITFWYVSRGLAKNSEISPRGFAKAIYLNGFFTVASIVPQFLALELIENVPYVIAGKRLGMILFSVAIGIVLGLMSRFRSKHSAEVEDLKYRLSGTALMVLGMLIIIFWGKTP